MSRPTTTASVDRRRPELPLARPIDCRWRCWLLPCLLAVGCSTYAHKVTQIRQAYDANDLVAAEERIHAGLKNERHDGDVLRLEQAIVQLTSGQPEEAERLLREVRDRFADLEVSDAPQRTLSYWTDEQRRAYAGEDYEKVLIRALLALCSLMQDATDAEAYSLQMIAYQDQLIRAGADDRGTNPKSSYQRVALAPYLRGLLREATHRDYDDAQRDYEMVASWAPEFKPALGDLQRVAEGHHSAEGHGVLYVFAMTGRGPYKEEAIEAPSSVSLLIASDLLSHFGDQTVPPNIAPVKIARLVARPNEVESVAVAVNQQPVGTTSTITDVTSLAINQFQAVYPQVVARAVVRRLLKKGVVYGAKQASDVSRGSLTSVALDLAGVAWEAAESADTRCWGLLPDQIQVLRLELPVGPHAIELAAVRAGTRQRGPVVTGQVEIADGRNTFLLANFPGPQLVGRVLVSQP